jgi:hypothetical protein
VKDHAGLRFVTLAGKYLDIHRGKQEQEEDEAAFIKQQELINKARRLKRQEAIEKMMEEEGMHPAQHGLTMPKVKGISVPNTLTDADTTTATKKKARKKLVEVDEIGEYLKGESNVDLLDILNRY